MSPRVTQACATKKVHNKPLKYQTTTGMEDLNVPKPQQWNSTDHNIEQDTLQFMMIKFQNVMINLLTKFTMNNT